jgi:XisI protein
MDFLDTWRDELERILVEHAAIPYAHGEIHSEVVVDRKRDRYLLLDIGWQGYERAHGVLIHVDIINHRFWIQYDGTEEGIATKFVAMGVPHEQIVLAFKHPELRKYTEFAAA